MATSDEADETNWRRRGLLLLLVAILVLFGAGIGSFILNDSPPADGNETTPTATVTPTPTSTPVDEGPTATSTPTATPGGTETAAPDDDTDTPTETPADTDTPTATPTATPTEVSNGGGDSGGGGGSTTPSPGLELGDDGPLLSTSNLAPGDTGQGILTLRNAAEEDGELTISAIDLNDSENGIVDPEADVDSSPNEGELSEHLEVRVAIEDGAGNREYLLGTDGGYVPLADLPARVPSSEYALASGEEVTLVTDWRLPSSTGNIVQSDGVSIDVGLTLQSTD